LQVQPVQFNTKLLKSETERAGFEPAIGFKPDTAFPVLLLQPLGHLSGKRTRQQEPLAEAGILANAGRAAMRGPLALNPACSQPRLF